MNAIDVANIVNGLAKLEYNDATSLLTKLPWERLMKSLEVSQVGMLCGAFAKLGWRDISVLKQLTARARGICEGDFNSLVEGTEKDRRMRGGRRFSPNAGRTRFGEGYYTPEITTFIPANYLPNVVQSLALRLKFAGDNNLREAVLVSLLREDCAKFSASDLVLMIPCLPLLFATATPAPSGAASAACSGLPAPGGLAFFDCDFVVRKYEDLRGKVSVPKYDRREDGFKISAGTLLDPLFRAVLENPKRGLGEYNLGGRVV